MSDKLPALPPRPPTYSAETFVGSWQVFDAGQANDHMDAQDARIKELEGWWSKVNIELNAQTVRALEAEIHIAELEDVCKEAGNELSKLLEATTKRIAELEREIREARKLLFEGGRPSRDTPEFDKWEDSMEQWLARNGEKEQ
jgi:hypothetical protein